MTDPVEILVEHVLLTSRGGLAACAAERCEWEDKFYPSKDLHDPRVPLHVRVAHAEHQLELLATAGLEQRSATDKKTSALRQIRNEVELMLTGGLTTREDGITFYEPVYPLPRCVLYIKAAVERGLGE